MRTLCGIVSNRHGLAADNLAPVQQLISERIGLPPLVPGTLNVVLTDPYIVQENTVIRSEEYNRQETLKLQRCRVRGLRCCIIRPDSHETQGNDGAKVLEIMSEYCLRNHLGLSNGDQLEVEVEGDEVWWQAQR